MKTMFDLPWELERPSVPPANPPTPKTTGQADQPDQPKKKRKPRKRAMSFLSEEEIERLFGVIASIRDSRDLPAGLPRRLTGVRNRNPPASRLRRQGRQDLRSPAEGFE